MQIGTGNWLLMEEYITVAVFCLAELVDEQLDSNYHGNWGWVGYEKLPPNVARQS